MGLFDEIQELANFFGASVSGSIDDDDFDVNEYLGVNQPSKPLTQPSGQFKRVTTDVPQSLHQLAYKYLLQMQGKPYGSYIPFDYNGKSYRAVLEEHVGGRVPGPHPGVSLFVQDGTGSPVEQAQNKIQFAGEVFNKVESKSAPGNFRIPCNGALVSTHAPGRATKTHPQGHFGVDIGGAKGTSIYAIGPGFVKSITNESNNPKGGNTITTVHNNGELTSYYAHLDSINVKPGQRVDKTTVIGTLGDSGMIYNGKKRITAPHIHWQVKVNGQDINPLDVERIQIG